MRKKILEKRLQRLQSRKKTLTERAMASQDVKEVRSLNEEIETVNAEIEETQDEIAAIVAQEPDGAGTQEGSPANEEQEGQQRSNPPAGAVHVNGHVMGGILGTFPQTAGAVQQRQDNDRYASLEYRQAFMAHVQTGRPIPAEYARRDADGMGPVTTQDIGAIIPTTILQEFIKQVSKVYGQLYSKVRKLNVRGGVKIPISDLSANFKWISEGTVSPRQSAGEIKKFIEFSYNIGEIRVSQTLLSSIVSLDLFESEIVRVMVEAYVKAMDLGIVKGSGNGQMLGFLNDDRVTGQADHVVELTAAEISNWTAWRKKLFAKLPISKRSGEFIFAASTVESYLMTMADANNNPIFRQAADLSKNDADGSTYGRFFGRDVSLVEPDVIEDFDTASAGDVIGVYWTPLDYAINTNQQFGMKRWYDEDKNEWVNKALTIVDGKMLDVSGIYLIKKKG